LEMARLEVYDLILMDVQMPVMDGLKATAAIRRLPGYDAVPIIAMTANAFEEDRQECLNAGMNDHLAKPISLDRLYSVLVKWIQPNISQAVQPNLGDVEDVRPTDVNTIVPTVTPETLEKLAAAEGLDVTAGLKMLQGNTARYVRILGQFISLYENIATDIMASIEKSDLISVQHSAHALKGAAGTLGAKKIQELAADLEKTAKSCTDPQNSNLEQLDKLLAQEISQLTEHYHQVVIKPQMKYTTVEVGTETRNQVSDILLQLNNALVNNNAEANELFESSRDLLVQILGDLALELEKHILNFDYADALETLKKFKF
jgi:two-component system sensor histidine kinase/response regulator